jgi:hypothetical protein
MSTKNENEIVRIDLTQEQKDQVKTATDKSAEAIELTVKELEARITPLKVLYVSPNRHERRAKPPSSRGARFFHGVANPTRASDLSRPAIPEHQWAALIRARWLRLPSE